jgi:hypothetical protein
MNRDFGQHFAAWFVLGTLVLLCSGFGLKPEGTWMGPGASGAEIFCYSFVVILAIACAGAVLDVLVFCPFVERVRRRHRSHAA